MHRRVERQVFDDLQPDDKIVSPRDVVDVVKVVRLRPADVAADIVHLAPRSGQPPLQVAGTGAHLEHATAPLPETAQNRVISF